MSNEHVNEVFRGALNAMFETPCRVNADLRERERLIECAEAHAEIPDFTEVKTVEAVLPKEVAWSVAHLINLLHMGPGATRDQFRECVAMLERDMNTLAEA